MTESSGAAAQGSPLTNSQLQARVLELESQVAGLQLRLSQQDLFEDTFSEQLGQVRGVLDSLFIYLVILRPDGTIIKANRAPLESAGLTMDEVRGRQFLDQQWWVARPGIEGSIRDAVARARDGIASHFDISVTTRSGKPLVLDLMISAVLDEMQRAKFLVVCGVDISDRVRFQQALTESESRFRSTFENAAVGMAQLAIDGQWLAVNDKLCSILGYEREELLGLCLREISHPQDSGKQITLPDRLLNEHRSKATVEKRYIKKDGSVVWANVTASPALNTQGDVDYLIAIIEDITSRKETEFALRDSENKFRAMAENIPQLAWMADAGGWIYWYNRRWYEYTGTNQEQMKGWGWQAVHDPAELPEVMNRWSATLKTGEPFEMVFPLRGADGTFRPFLTQVLPVRDGRGEISGWFGTNTDITEQKQVEDALRRSNNDLEQFAYAASHDLQEPIRTIATLTQLLERHTEYTLDEMSREWMAHIVTNAKRMGTLIADLLTYSRTTLDGSLQLEPVDLNQVLADVRSNLRTQIESSGAKITSETLPVVSGNRAQLGQVFQNLISNAIRFAKTGEEPSINTSVRRKGGDWLLAVADNGQGFDPAYADRVFGIFKRLHGTDIPGNGIGLAICKAVINRHGGQIWVDAAENQGATFFFTLPG